MSSKTIFTGRVFDLVEKTMTLPNGRVTTQSFVSHRGAAVIVPFLTKQSVILLRQYRPVPQKYLYELPAGTVEKNESPLACARREIIEETGYTAQYFTKLGIIHPVPGYSTEVITIYKAEKLSPKIADGDLDEVIRPVVVTKKDVQRLFKAGKLTDAKTICSFAICKWL